MLGLKLVKKAKHPSMAWPTDSVSYGDAYGVAVVVYNFKSSFKIVPGDSNIKNINCRKKVSEISSNYLYKRELLEAASDFFEYGFNVWTREDECMFEASWSHPVAVINFTCSLSIY
ncbi:hypothetical protein C5167_019551 [Papaver somniferum]|uniref:Uncharacterized protein n=1 Tax=Papaver somniferum TaxID=3469 RepID=A0A4Y7ITR5_PAPSO|nr:hypothetical protein C5167_019551 [Papaver somniferum]